MKTLVLATISFSSVLLIPPAASAGDPLAVKVIQASNYSSAAEVRFVLDDKESCDSKDGADCLFSSDCSEPVHGICVKSNAELGTHKLEAFVNGQHLVAWAHVTNPDTTGVLKGGVAQCSLQQDDGFTLTCL